MSVFDRNLVLLGGYTSNLGYSVGGCSQYLSIQIVDFWVVTPCSLIQVYGYENFGEARCLHLHGLYNLNTRHREHLKN
jgi:hypothetical protein